ncbi:MAG TPA: NAD(P)-dependent oxidoreductase [Bacteroidetes bacterium]|jgi:3-hydroxy acid dehydrogenase / malonic semialdehyde reductase|nr:MAG: short-chain dehydrogenase [Sphingobacteriales bacterium BACL12 MAG-120802-bin5]KRP12536.1 MAG: short-chain dehydrogenase [Sphingobacteriales bacterium BACL12 MAG-120813-bin55]HCK22171.1 NAD(P)-dependent oxidoreductase [Bacteroidota bacterium]
MPTVCITGASSGFGKACAAIFADNGYDLIITARRAQELHDYAQELRDTHAVQVLPLVFDVRDAAATAAAFEGLQSPFREIAILINNAGLAVGRDSVDAGVIEDWDRMVDTNVKGLLYVTRAVVPGMVERKKGHIINVSSLAGQEVYPGGNVYCATKHAVTALSKGMRMDLVQHGIKVTNISPGLAETEFSVVRFKGDKDKADHVYAGYTPLSAQDVAEVIWFAASRPAHVNLEELTILPTAQSDSRTVVKA